MGINTDQQNNREARANPVSTHNQLAPKSTKKTTQGNESLFGGELGILTLITTINKRLKCKL